MSKIKTHKEDCKRILGEEFEYVHKWLDEYTKEFPVQKYFERHRLVRHNPNGLKQIKEMWGDESLEAGKLHLIRDDELYVLFKPMSEVKRNEIEDIYNKLKMIYNGFKNWEV